MSIIESVTEFISTCPYLSEMAAIYTDCTDSEPDNYGISDYGEGEPISTYMDGSAVCQHNFALYFRTYTNSDRERIEATGFFEKFSDWLDIQTRKRNLPKLSDGKSAESMRAANAMMFSQDEDGVKGLYQAQFILIYEKG